MKKIGIVTINDDNNYGNRLQNYAIQEYLNKYGFNITTIRNNPITNKKEENKLIYFFRIMKKYYWNIKNNIILKKNKERYNCFMQFNKYINFAKKDLNLIDKKVNNEYDYFITGSDQVWNPTFGRLRDTDLLGFADFNKRISFSASFGVSKLPKEFEKEASTALMKFKAISVREDVGKTIVEELTNRTDVEVLVDPTMLLTVEEWDKVAKKPRQLEKDKYILNYFLGEMSEKRKKEIERIAKENNCEIINILDKNSPFYQTGPSEFVYLEKNAFLVCTDSFHSCVFAIIYNRPFIVFNREDSNVSMNSRIETLLTKFGLQDRNYNGKITPDLLKHDYSESYKILEKEKEKSKKFLKRALDYNE